MRKQKEEKSGQDSDKPNLGTSHRMAAFADPQQGV
jgi:hypothetical protein